MRSVISQDHLNSAVIRGQPWTLSGLTQQRHIIWAAPSGLLRLGSSLRWRAGASLPLSTALPSQCVASQLQSQGKRELDVPWAFICLPQK